MSSVVDRKFLETVEKHKLFKKRDKIIVAVSGGADSMCLLHLLASIRNSWRLELVCAHFNHLLRKTAGDDEAFVRDVCRLLRIRFVSGKKNVAGLAKGDSLEQTARKLRFDFFLSCCRRFKIKKIALAHHQDDVVETVLMRILRGAALRGLRGILPKTSYHGVVLIRPLIEVGKQDVLSWLKAHTLAHREDETNSQEIFLRNRVRRSLIPQLKTFNPNIEGTLLNLARAVACDYDFIHTYCSREYHALKRNVRGEIHLDIDVLTKFHPAVMAGVLRLAIEEAKGDLRRLELRHYREVEDLIANRISQSIVYLPGVAVKKDGRFLSIKTLLL